MRNATKHWLCLIPALHWAPNVLADYKADIGYTELHSILGAAMPTGSGVSVTQIEASSIKLTVPPSPNYPIYAPDTNNVQFAGKNFFFPGTPSTSASTHATDIGSRFYGSNALAYGIDTITSYEVNAWISSIASNTASAPINASRIANHSWVGNGDTTAGTSAILRLVDRQVQRNEYIQVVGMDNNASYKPLLGSAYNAIAVGRTDGGQDHGSDAVDSVYIAGRTRPDLVAPETTTSAATPIVSSAAALLVETGHNGASTLSHGSIDISGVGTVYNAERSETIKAALMAGADRVTNNSSTAADIDDYRNSGHETANGLDDRYGAGQLNILHSYQIIAAGEQDSTEDGGGLIDAFGFDYDGNFGGSSGGNAIATYQFAADTDLNFAASLAWNIGVSNNANLTTTLYDLNLELFDITSQATAAFSTSTADNTENLWLTLAMGHSYQLRVKSGTAENFSWDYALAWYTNPLQTAPVPLPATFFLFASAIAGLGAITRRKVS